MSYQTFIVDYYKKKLLRTGVNTYVRNISKNHTTNFIWFDSPFFEIKKVINEKGEIHVFVPFDITLQSELSEQQIEKIDLILKYISEICEKKTLLFHFNWLHHSSIIPRLHQKISCKTILTCHYIYFRDLIVKNYFEFYKINQILLQNKKNSFLFKNIVAKEFILYQKFDHIITVTYDAKNVLHQLFEIPKGKITHIYNGIDLEEITVPKSPQQLRKKYHFSESEKIILFVGRITQMKGIAELIQAFEKLLEKDNQQKYRLVICGKGNYDWLYEQIHCYSQITLTGNLTKEQLYEFYKLADVGVVPSYAEQCSYTAIEMMASKLPIVVTDVGGLNELIDNENGLKTHIEFTPEKIQFNIDDLTEKIHQSLTNSQLATKRAEKAFQKVKTTLIAERMAVQTFDVYEKLLKQPENKPIIDQTELVSIVIPCYNAERYIEECLQSVLNQSYQNFEILLIDDASEDKTLEIISKINDNRIKILRNSTNKGIVYTLNKGISKAQGTYIARLDSDDLMQRDRIAKQVSFLRKNQEYAMVGTNHILINEKGDALQYIAYPETNEEIQVFKYFFNPISHPATLFRTFLFKEFQYDNEYPHCEDYSLWFKTAERYKIANLPDYATLYRIHKNNLSSKNDKEQQENAFSLILDEFEKLGLELSDEEIKIHSAIFSQKGKAFFNSTEKIESLKKWIDKILKVLKDDNKVFKETLLQYCEIWE